MHTLLFLTALLAADPEQTPKVDFVRDVRPIFVKHCNDCHGTDEQESGLRLDVRAKALEGGDSGRVIVSGKSGESALLARVISDDEDEIMPPEGERLSEKQVAIIRAWIDQGANWPDSAAGEVQQVSEHWAFQKPVRHDPPTVKNLNWPRNEIDAFVLARLEQDGIAPSPEADRSTLMRRLFLDLIGLPPTIAERKEFLNDTAPDAYEKLVDRLLASKHFGERWGRHWLDMARYADSNGYERDDVRPHAWRYRDWVIAAVNADQAFDQFVIEQLAGDLLPDAALAQKTATGFHRMTLTNTESGINKEDYRNRTVVDRVNTTGTVLLGMSVGCGQCHSHKYDPLSQKEYYRLYAFFNNVEETNIDLKMTPEEEATYNARKAAYDAKKKRLQGLSKALSPLASKSKADWVDALTPEIAEKLKIPQELHRGLLLTKSMRDKQQQEQVDAYYDDLVVRNQTISTDLRTLGVEERYIKKPYAMTISQRTKEPRETHVLLRGDFKTAGRAVQPGVPDIFPPLKPRGKTADRLDLAHWLVGPENPLTSRVAVNHIWGHLFGRGLVTTVDDFGTQGAPPSHPKLLDWLATEYPARNWSRKQLIKLIVSSAAYRQSSRTREDIQKSDPDNALLSRQSRFRVDGEIVRDMFLAAGGLLSRKVGGPTIRPPLPESVLNLSYKYRTIWEASQGEDRFRRGMYIHFKRTNPFPSLMAFDCPEANVANVRRNRSNTPLQALTALNDPVFVECAQALGRRLLSEESTDITARMQHAGLLCLSRDLTNREIELLTNIYRAERTEFDKDSKSAGAFVGEYALKEHPAAETAAWIAVARTIMNLDEFITRE